LRGRVHSALEQNRSPRAALGTRDDAGLARRGEHVYTARQRIKSTALAGQREQGRPPARGRPLDGGTCGPQSAAAPVQWGLTRAAAACGRSTLSRGRPPPAQRSASPGARPPPRPCLPSRCRNATRERSISASCCVIRRPLAGHNCSPRQTASLALLLGILALLLPLLLDPLQQHLHKLGGVQGLEGRSRIFLLRPRRPLRDAHIRGHVSII
jgi:hypothetical protein